MVGVFAIRRRTCRWRLSGSSMSFAPSVERAECGKSGDEHPHGVSVVVKSINETLTHVLVNEGVVGDVVMPNRELLGSWKFSVEEEVRDFQKCRLLCQLLDRVAAVPENSVVTIKVGNCRLARRCLHVCRVIDEERGSSDRIADAGNTPPSIGTVTVCPVLSSVIVIVSATAVSSNFVGRTSCQCTVFVRFGGQCWTNFGSCPQRGELPWRRLGRLSRLLASIDSRGADGRTSICRVDDVIDIPALGCNVMDLTTARRNRSQTQCGPRRWLPDARSQRLGRTHHSKFCPGPSKTNVISHLLRVHHDVRSAITLAKNDADARDGGSSVSKDELSAMV